MRHTTQPDRPGWTLVLILLASWTLRLIDLGWASLWIDEKLVEMWRHQSPADAYSSILSFGTEMPLHALLLRLVPVEDELTLRLPSALLGMLGVALVIAAARNLFHDRSLALWCGALIAANPLHVWLSRTARAYALVFVLALFATYLFLRILAGSRSRSAWLAFTVASAAAYLAHFFCLFLPLAQAITVLRDAPRETRRRWILAQSLAALPVALWSAQIIVLNLLSDGRFLGSHGDWLRTPTLLDLPVTLANLTTGYDGRAGAWMWAPAVGAAGVGLWRGWVTATGKSPASVAARHLALLAGLPIALSFVVAQSRPIYLDRYFVVALPALVILMATGWRSLRSRLLRVTLPALVIVTGVTVIAVDLQAGAHEKVAWRQAGLYLASAVQPGDSVLLDRSVALDPFQHYFLRTTDDLALWAWSESDGAFPNPLPARLWIVYPNPHTDLHRQGALPGFDPLEPGLTPIGDWLAGQPTVSEAAAYPGVTILLIAQPGESGTAP